MKPQNLEDFQKNYDVLLKRFQLNGLAESTIKSYSIGVRRLDEYFHSQISDLTEAQLTDYFSKLLETHSWSAVKLDLYGGKFYYEHVLHKAWPAPKLVRPPKRQRLADIMTLEQIERILKETKVLSYRVFFYVSYSLGLRISECLNLTVADIDADHMRVHIRDSKGNKDRFVPLADDTLCVLRRFWSEHRHPTFLFPSRKGKLKKAHLATNTLCAAGVQKALSLVTRACGLKKELPRTVCVTATQRT